MTKIAILGAGSWGSALALLLAEKNNDVILWCRREEQALEINAKHTNEQYLSGISFPKRIIATNDFSDIKQASTVIFATPSHYIRKIATDAVSFIPKDAIVMHVAKGIEQQSGKFMSQILQEILHKKSIAVLSGPNHAEEVVQHLPTATVIAAHNLSDAQQLCTLFSTSKFKPYPLSDVRGVEICGAMKNIVALALGVCDGLKLGDNAKGSILTLGLDEMSTVAHHFGAKKSTCYGLAGIGDLVATCFSAHSRNRFVGEMLAKGKSLEEIKKKMHGMIAEGVHNTKTIYDLCKKKNLETPLVACAYSVLYDGMDLKKAIDELLARV